MFCTCKKDELPKHPCPFEEHVGLNTKPHCCCCDHCKEQCEMDVTDVSEKWHKK